MALPDEAPERPGSEDQADQEETADSNEQTDVQTALLPKNFFGEGVQVGDKGQIEVVAINDDEIQVRYVGSDASEEAGEEAGEEEAPPVGDPEMQGMLAD